MRRSLVPLLLVLTTLPMPVVSAQDDAGTGGDAPNSAALAVDVEQGTFDGALDHAAGDSQDWYRLRAAPGALFRVVSSNVSTDIYASDATALWYHQAPRGATWFQYVEVPADGVILLRIARFRTPAIGYDVDARESPRPDLVATLTVDEPADPGSWTPRAVHVRFENRGGPMHGVLQIVGSHGYTPGLGLRSPRWFLYDTTDFAAGEVRESRYWWDPTGHIGTTVLEAGALVPFEKAWKDSGTSRSYAFLVDGRGSGFDVFGGGVATIAGGAGAWGDGEGNYVGVTVGPRGIATEIVVASRETGREACVATPWIDPQTPPWVVCEPLP